MLKGKTVILGVSGGIAAYKIPNLASMLVKSGADVHVLMTENAAHFITAVTFETLTGHKCIIDTFDRNFFLEQAEKFQRPVVCFVDTSGAFCGMGAEERGQGQAIAENLTTMAGLKTPIISVLIGEGGSGGALALALSDRVWILENAVYSVISPEGCASILWKDSKKVKDAAESLRLTAQDMLELGVVEQVIPEEKEFSLTYAKLQEELEAALSQLGQLPVEELLEQRYQRFRKY